MNNDTKNIIKFCLNNLPDCLQCLKGAPVVVYKIRGKSFYIHSLVEILYY